MEQENLNQKVQNVNDVIATANTETAENSELDGKYLTFWTDGQLFGLPIAKVVQIVSMQKITGVPEFPYYAKGIINLRGGIIPVIDVRLRFGKMEKEYDERTCIIVISTKSEDAYVGLIVDGVDEVTDILNEEISTTPKMSNDYTDSFLTGIGKLKTKIVLLINVAKIVGDSDFNLMQDLI